MRAHNQQGVGKVVSASSERDENLKNDDYEDSVDRLIRGGTLGHTGAAVAGGVQSALEMAYQWAPEVVAAYTSPEAMESFKKGDFSGWQDTARFDLMSQVDNFEMDLADSAMSNHNLTPNQARLFAANLTSGMDMTSKEQVANRELQLKGDYAESFDNTIHRRPQLTERNEAMTDAMAAKIGEAARIGPTAAGSVLSDIRRINMHRAPLKP